MTNTTKKKIISFSLIIFGILVLIAGIMMVQTGFATFDDNEPRVGIYIGGIFTIIAGVFLTVGGTIYLNFERLKRRLFIRLARLLTLLRKRETKRNKPRQIQSTDIPFP